MQPKTWKASQSSPAFSALYEHLYRPKDSLSTTTLMSLVDPIIFMSMSSTTLKELKKHPLTLTDQIVKEKGAWFNQGFRLSQGRTCLPNLPGKFRLTIFFDGHAPTQSKPGLSLAYFLIYLFKQLVSIAP